MGKGKEVSFNVSKLLFLFVCFLFFAFVKTSLYGKFKKFKTNKAILTIVIKTNESYNDENILMKYFSSKEKKIFQKSVWDWYLAVVWVIWGKGLGVTIQIFFPK